MLLSQKKQSLPKRIQKKRLGALIDAVIEAVAAGDKVQVVGFGTFELRERAERMGRNPRTGEEMVIAASKQPVFKAGKAFKDAVSE